MARSKAKEFAPPKKRKARGAKAAPAKELREQQRHAFAHELRQHIRLLRDTGERILHTMRGQPAVSGVSEKILSFDFRSRLKYIEEILLAWIESYPETPGGVRDPILKKALERSLATDQELLMLREQVFSQVQPLLREGIGVRFDAQIPSTVAIRMDESNFRIIIHNLLANAFKYSARSSVVLCKARAFDNHLRLTVHNMGPSIEANEEHLLFARGFRGGNAEHMEVLGNGLGLYMARAVCELHGCSLSYQQTLLGHSDRDRPMAQHQFALFIPNKLIV